MELAPGPVEMRPDILDLASSQPRYFRTAAFSDWMLALEEKFLRVLGLDSRHQVIFLTGSGTAGMEAVAFNFLPHRDALIIASGQFGARMGDIARRRGTSFDIASIDPTLPPQDNLKQIALEQRSICFATVCETSNGYYLDPRLIREAGLPRDALLICDGVSATFIDPFDAHDADVLIIGSQKGLGLLPGMSFIVLSDRAIDHIESRERCDSLYFDFKLYLSDMQRGQTPFSPALTILTQLDRALDDIIHGGGLAATTRFRAGLARAFRDRLRHHGVSHLDHHVSNAVTVIDTAAIDAERVVEILRDKHDITVATNAPPMKQTRFRVSHMGHNSAEDMVRVADAIHASIVELS
jgi:aspartate aminotransferase-like enzyme